MAEPLDIGDMRSSLEVCLTYLEEQESNQANVKQALWVMGRLAEIQHDLALYIEEHPSQQEHPSPKEFTYTSDDDGQVHTARVINWDEILN